MLFFLFVCLYCTSIDWINTLTLFALTAYLLKDFRKMSTSPDSHADFCNKLSPTDLNFGPFFLVAPFSKTPNFLMKPNPSYNSRNVQGILVLSELQDDAFAPPLRTPIHILESGWPKHGKKWRFTTCFDFSCSLWHFWWMQCRVHFKASISGDTH